MSSAASSDPFAEEVPCEHPEADHIDGRGMVCVDCGESVSVTTTGGKPKRSRPVSAASNLRWEFCGDEQPHGRHELIRGALRYNCPGKIESDQESGSGKRGAATSPEGLGASPVEPASPAPATSAATRDEYDGRRDALASESGTAGEGPADVAGAGADRAVDRSHDPVRVAAVATAFLRRCWLTLVMTWDYSGRFPKRKLLGLYWKQAGRMVKS